MYRIVECKEGEYYSLFHGTSGSRHLPKDEWLWADVKRVKNPGTSKHSFISGFHVIPCKEEAEDYLTKFSSEASKRYQVIEVLVDGDVRPKPRSRSNVLLAEKIYILT